MSLSFCTIIASNYWAQARVLARSLRRHHPESCLTVLIVDGEADEENPMQDNVGIAVLYPQDLGISTREFHSMATMYEVSELCTAMKPWLLKHLLDTGSTSAAYLDPDIEVFAPFDYVGPLAEEHGIVLTPHTLEPRASDGLAPSEIDILRAGAFNLGFIGVGGSEANSFLEWWAKRLLFDCLVDVEPGLFVDQKWIDLVPSYFGYHTLRDPGLNVAYWNADQRTLVPTEGGYEVAGGPLRFFHFSGFRPERPDRLTSYWSNLRVELHQNPCLVDLCQGYSAHLMSEGYEDCSLQPYRFDQSSGGLKLDSVIRRLYREAVLSAGQGYEELPPDPFDPDGGHAFYEWLTASSRETPRISRYLRHFYQERPDLVAAFPNLKRDFRIFLSWARAQSAIPPEFCLDRGEENQEMENFQPGLVRADTLAEIKDRIEPRKAPLVAIPVFNAFKETMECIRAMDRHCPPGTDVLVIDDGSVESRLPKLLASLDLARIRIYFWRRKANLGFVATVNQAFEAAGRRDVVLVNSDIVVGPHWLERMEVAAFSDKRVATVTAMTNSGTIVSVPNGQPDDELLPAHTLDSAARAVATGARRNYPEIPVCVGHLVYVRRSALDLVGPYDEAFSPGYSEEVDFSLRCSAAGLSHVCADDVYVYHSGSASFGFGDRANAHRRWGDKLIEHRYPFFFEWIQEFAASDQTKLSGAIATAKIALYGLDLLVDARCLGPDVLGTQRVTLEVIAALARNERVTRLGVLASLTAQETLEKVLPDQIKIEFLQESDISSLGKKFDSAFRPFQVHTNAGELSLLRQVAHRTIVWQLDFIAYDNPFYHPSGKDWHDLRDLTRLVAGTADGVALLSNYLLEQGINKGLIDNGRGRSRVIYPGTNHTVLTSSASRPSAIPSDSRFEKYLLCFGADYLHKNRLYALRLFKAMFERGYEGGLLLVGSLVPHGSSRLQESAILGTDPATRNKTLILGAVSDQERNWLFQNADLVLYPSLTEGFGLVPFEAAAAKVPCLASRQASLDEILPPGIYSIEDWDVQDAAGIAMNLIDDPNMRQRQVELLQHRASDFSWESCADQVVDFSIEVCGTGADGDRHCFLPNQT